MGTTYLKRQKEMKRLEKQREKTERRAQKKLAKSRQKDVLDEGVIPGGDEGEITNEIPPPEPMPQN